MSSEDPRTEFDKALRAWAEAKVAEKAASLSKEHAKQSHDRTIQLLNGAQRKLDDLIRQRAIQAIAKDSSDGAR